MDLTGRKMDTREQVIKWLNDNGHAKVTSKIIPLDNGNFRPVVDVIMGYLEQVKSVDLADVVGRSEQLNCDHEWKVEAFDCYGMPYEQYCEHCGKKEAI